MPSDEDFRLRVRDAIWAAMTRAFFLDVNSGAWDAALDSSYQCIVNVMATVEDRTLERQRSIVTGDKPNAQ